MSRDKYLVSTSWVQEHMYDADIRLVFCVPSIPSSTLSIIPNSAIFNWELDLTDSLYRDCLKRSDFEILMRRSGISNDTKVIFYGQESNWWAAYALWIACLFEHEDLALLDGGLDKWKKEGREVSHQPSVFPKSNYVSRERNDSTERAFLEDMKSALHSDTHILDVRSAKEYLGLRAHMEGYIDGGIHRKGHIPGAKHGQWALALNEDGTFKSNEELEKIYLSKIALDRDKETIVYCRVGERSSLIWFVLRCLLDFRDVKNYDGSWSEWGNLIGTPIEKVKKEAI